ncbi:MAG: hypothetical protein GY801_31115 [bacterium]|nr:hypothetical protein [bacterium]
MKASKVFVDTNILIYQTFEDFDEEKHRLVENMLQQLHARQWGVYI